MRKLMYETSQTLVYKVQESQSKKVAVVIGNGDIIDFRPMKMQETLNDAKTEFNRRFEEKARVEKKVFSFGTTKVTETTNNQLDGTEECQEPEVGFEEI